MEIWSSPAAYDELNGNAERGGGADPIARELEEGEGGPGGPAPGMGIGMRLQQCWAPPGLVRSSQGLAGAGAGPERSGPGSRRGRGWSGAVRAGSSLGRCRLFPTCAFPQPRSPSPLSGPGLPPPGPLGTPRITPTLRRPVPAPGVVGRGRRDGARGPARSACARGEGCPSPRGNGVLPTRTAGSGPQMDVYVFASAAGSSPRASRSLQP